MSREIKYRAWDKQEKQMVYGIEETYDGLPYSELNEKVELDIYNHMSCFSSWLCGDYEVMQCAGFKDKKGVEIYEGDIIFDGSNNYYVELKHGMFKPICYASLDNECKAWGYKVVGNIYENPKLLEANS